MLLPLFGAWIDRSLHDNILDPDVRDRIRREWSIEVRDHQRAMECARDRERQWNEREQKWELEWKEKMDDWAEKKDRWQKEEQQWDEKVQRREREWGKETDDWNKKKDEWRRLQEGWAREKERREREEAKERWEREHMNLYWEDVRGGEKCVAHKTKEYSARLANLLPRVDAMDACKSTPFSIHGVAYESPLHCEDRVSNVSLWISVNSYQMAWIREPLGRVSLVIGWSIRIHIAQPSGNTSKSRYVVN